MRFPALTTAYLGISGKRQAHHCRHLAILAGPAWLPLQINLRRAVPTVSGSVSGGTEGRYVTRQKASDGILA